MLRATLEKIPRIAANMLRALAAVMAVPAVLCALVLVPGCDAQQDGGTIQIGINDFPSYELLYLAQEKGFYRDEGVQVRIVEFASLSDAARAFGNKQLDAIATTLVDLVIADQNDPGNMKAGWVLHESTGADTILGGTQVRNINDLYGRRVGLETTSVGLLVLGRALQLHNMALKDVKLVNLDPLSGESALARGEIDALVTYAPYSVRLAKKPGIRKIFDTRAIPGEIVDVLAFSAELVTGRASDIKRIVRAYMRAQSFLREQPEQAIAIMAQRERIDASSFRQVLENDLHLLTAKEQAAYLQSGARLEQQIGLTAEYLQHVGIAKVAPDARRMVVDPALLQGNAKH